MRRDFSAGLPCPGVCVSVTVVEPHHPLTPQPGSNSFSYMSRSPFGGLRGQKPCPKAVPVPNMQKRNNTTLAFITGNLHSVQISQHQHGTWQDLCFESQSRTRFGSSLRDQGAESSHTSTHTWEMLHIPHTRHR